MELRENRTELERLLGDVWDYQDGGHEKTHLPKWLFALTLVAAVMCTSSPSDIVVPVVTALAPAPEKLSIDNVSSQNVAEDLDYRIARHADSAAGWRAFLAAHPDGPHAQAARAEIDHPQPASSPQPDRSQEPTQMADDAAQETAPPSPSPVMVEEPAPPAPPVEVAEQSPPSSPATQPPVEAAPSPPAPAVMAEAEPAPPEPVAALADAPLPPSRPRVIAAAKPFEPLEPAEPAHRSHSRAVHHHADRPNALTILIAQLFHRHGQRQDIGWR